MIDSIDSIAASSVRAVDPPGVMTNMTKKAPGSTEPVAKTVDKTQGPSGQDIKADADESQQDALTKLREALHEFTDGVLRPKNGLVGKKTYETSFSQAMENLAKEYNGALAGFYDKLHGFAFGILQPEDEIVGSEIYDSSHSMTMENLSKEYIGAAAGIKNTLHEYAKKAAESTGPPVTLVEPIKILHNEAPDAPAADMPRDTKPVDTTV